MNDSREMLISVVIPVYKSEDILHELCSRLHKVFDTLKINYEVIMVNDYSPDKSWERMVEISKENPKVKSILLRKNVGYECAVMAGLNLSNGNFVVLMDDDLQHAPEDIPKLIEEIEKGYDVVYANFTAKKQSLFKNIGSWFNGKIAQFVIKKPKDIYLSPFKVMKKEIADEVIKYYGPFPYVDGLIFRITSSIHQIPITHYKRKIGKGNYNLYRSFKIWLNLFTGFSVLPLRFATLIGIFMSFTAFVLSILLIIWKYILGGEAPLGWGTNVFIALMIGGIQLIVLGITGEYIGRIYLSVNKQPQFIIKEMNNFIAKDMHRN